MVPLIFTCFYPRTRPDTVAVWGGGGALVWGGGGGGLWFGVGGGALVALLWCVDAYHSTSFLPVARVMTMMGSIASCVGVLGDTLTKLQQPEEVRGGEGVGRGL